MARGKKFPLDPNAFKTEKEGQVAGLSGGKLKKILKEHGITLRLSSEGGRTSRGSMGLMHKYVEFLNRLHEEELLDFDIVEMFWIEQVREYFRNKPFLLMTDTARTIGAHLDDLFSQAKKRQIENPGMQYFGIVFQHLVGAKLSIILPPDSMEIHGAAVADTPTERGGDFVIGNTIIHCTTMPNNLLIEKCAANIRSGYHPVIITILERVRTALDMASDVSLDGRIEVWDIQQFLSSNIQEHSFFMDENRNSTIANIINRYNEIVLNVENDPSLRIDFER